MSGSVPERLVADRLVALGLDLPPAASPVANYVAFVRQGTILTISGQLPLVGGSLLTTGRLGAEVSVETGVEAARACFLNLLAQARLACDGRLFRIARIIRLGGFIACTADFTQHANVMNGASDLAVSLFGDAGRHARSTVGVASLPLGAPVEIEGTMELRD